MKIALLSDLHLSSDPTVREFTHEVGAFLDLLDTIERTHDAVFVAGDVFNLDLGRLPIGRGLEWRAARRVFDPIVRRFDHPPYRMVHGNHDKALRRLANVPEIWLETIGGRRVVMLHGHQFDGAAKQLPAIAPTGSWLNGWMHRLDAPRVADALVEIGRVANALDRRALALSRRLRVGARARREPGSEANSERRDVRSARNIAARYGADVVLMGHTHTSVQARFGADGPVYLNAGACAFGDLQWTSLDLDSLAWTHHQLASPTCFPGGRAHDGRADPRGPPQTSTHPLDTSP